MRASTRLLAAAVWLLAGAISAQEPRNGVAQANAGDAALGPEQTGPNATDPSPQDADQEPATADEEAAAEPLFDDGLDALLGDAEGAGSGEQTANRLSVTGFVELRPRVYTRDRGSAEALDKVNEQLLLDAEIELDWKLAKGLSAYVRPRLFIDLLDDDLYRLEPYEAYVTWQQRNWDLRLGQMVENWGIVDTYNPIDLLNRRDFATDILDARRLGELGLRWRRFFTGNEVFGEPTLSVYLMPLFRETRFATDSQRFGLGNPEQPFDEDDGFEPSGSEQTLAALRLESTLSNPLANADLQFLVARGPERTPTLQVDANGVLVPVYYGSRTVGAGLRAVPNQDRLGSFLASLTLKLEITHKSIYTFDDSPIAAPDDYLAYVLGFDRAFYNLLKDQDQLTLTLEYAGEDGAEDPSSLLRPFGDDLIARLFWEANNFARSSVELRGIYDLDSSETIVELILQTQLRQVHEDLQFSVQAQYFDPPGDNSSFFDFFPDSSSLAMALRWDF